MGATVCAVSNVPAVAQQLDGLAAKLPHQHTLEVGLTLRLLRCHPWAGSKGTSSRGCGAEEMTIRVVVNGGTGTGVFEFGGVCVSSVPAIAQQLGGLAAKLPHRHTLEAGLTLRLLRCHPWADSKGTSRRGGGAEKMMIRVVLNGQGARAPADLSSAVAIWDGGSGVCRLERARHRTTARRLSGQTPAPAHP